MYIYEYCADFSMNDVNLFQLNGFEVDPINSVQFSNHAGNVEFLNLPKSDSPVSLRAFLFSRSIVPC